MNVENVTNATKDKSFIIYQSVPWLLELEGMKVAMLRWNSFVCSFLLYIMSPTSYFDSSLFITAGYRHRAQIYDYVEYTPTH